MQTMRMLTVRRLSILYSHTLTHPHTRSYTPVQVLRENAHAMAITEPEIRVITDYEPKACLLSYLPTHVPTHSLTHSTTHLLTHSPTHSPTLLRTPGLRSRRARAAHAQCVHR